uniref:BOI-related E3 ubiquitin-protein ligase 1-like n=1 Tax=Erigeron canadensis TaxID=72917 RepID=UPI001CB89FA5|nr:BOI-related E3 ubiquitin-protein ligase 1-like [Erigeron canadensis]
MAVQAQYPSHIITHQDCNSLQLQSQPPPFLLHHPTDFHSPAESNSRKRRRDIDMNQLMSLLHHQQQQQLQHQNVDVSTGLRLSFNDQQHLQQQQHSLSSQSSVLSEEISTQITQQRYEIDRFLHTQSEELRRTLANKRQVHYHALIRTAEESISRRMKDKDAEAEKATRRNLELEARAAHLSAEAQVWQARAREHEIEAAALQSQLNDAIVSGRRRLANEAEVGLTCTSGDVQDAESAYIDPDRVVLMSGPGCKACGKRVASVVLLPCRHLCVCTECDGVVSACPLCLSFRSSSIEVYMS